MAGQAQKRKAGASATVFRKSAKKARQDKASSTRYEDDERNTKQAPKKSETSGAAKRAAAKAKNLVEAKNKKAMKLPNNYTDVRAKGKAPVAKASSKVETKPKTKHEFIMKKRQEAKMEEEKEKKQLAAKAKGKGKATEGKKKPTAESLPALVPTPPPSTSSFRIVFGSYERLLYGLNAKVSESPEGKLQVHLEPYFTFPAHVSSIRSVCCAGHDSKWLATGSTDEAIKVWDLRKRIEVGSLTGHEGTITSLHFPTRQYLITAGGDGRINIYRSRDWALLKSLKGHIGSVNDVAAHPSGRLALSVGKDKTIRMWDLMRGVGAASTKIGKEGESVAWDTQGTRFAVLAGNTLSVYNTEMSMQGEVTARVRWHDVKFQSVDGKELMFVAGEDKMVHVYDLQRPIDTEDGVPTFTEVARLGGHDNRVKSVGIVPVKTPSRQSALVATTISSDGLARVFDLSELPGALKRKPTKDELIPEFLSIASYDTKRSRLTCLSVVGVADSSAQADRSQAAEDDAEEGQSESDEEEPDSDVDDMAEEVDTEAEEEELKRLEQQIQEAKEAGLLETDEEEDDEDSDDGQESEVEDEEEAESA